MMIKMKKKEKGKRGSSYQHESGMDFHVDNKIRWTTISYNDSQVFLVHRTIFQDKF